MRGEALSADFSNGTKAAVQKDSSSDIYTRFLTITALNKLT